MLAKLSDFQKTISGNVCSVGEGANEPSFFHRSSLCLSTNGTLGTDLEEPYSAKILRLTP